MCSFGKTAATKVWLIIKIAGNNGINKETGSIKNLGGYCTTIINILIENYTKLTFRRGNRSMASMR